MCKRELSASQVIAGIIVVCLVATIPIGLTFLFLRYLYFGDLSGFPVFVDYLKFISGWIATAIAVYLRG